MIVASVLAAGLLLGGELGEQMLLRRARNAAAGFSPGVVPVRIHLPGLAVVGEIGPEPLLHHALLDVAVENREAQLDAPEEVASHPVGARQVEVLFSAVQ